MTLPIEIAQLPTIDTVQATTRLLVQDGVTGTPYQQTTVGAVFLDLIEQIGTGTVVAGDVVISGGTADLDQLIAASGTITDAKIIGGTGTFATGSISTLAVGGTLTVGTVAATSINAGTVDISSGKATLATGTITTGTVGTLISTTGTITTLNAGTITIGTGTGTLTTLNVTGTLDAGVGNVTKANIGTVDIKSGTAALQTLTADSGTITALSAPTLAVSGTVTAGHVAATSVTASGAIVGASGTITSINAGTVAVSGRVTAATGTITDATATTLAATGTATIGHAAVTTATVGTLVANAGTVTLAKATITDLAVTGLAASGTATVANLVGTVATIGTLTANSGTVTLGKATITDAVVTTGTVGTLIANAGTVSLAKGTITDLATGTVSVSGTATIANIAGTVINAGTITSSGAVSGASGTFTTASISTLAVSGTATVGTVSIDGNTTTEADKRWSLFGHVEADKNGAPIGWKEADGTHNFGLVKTTDFRATKGTITDATFPTATATIMNATTLDVDGNKSTAGDARWGLFGAVDTDKNGAPIAFKSIDGVYVFGAVRTGTLTLNNEPTASDHAVTKKYVDEASGGTSGAYTGIELEARDAQCMAQSMAVRDQTNATIATPCWEYSHVIHYGQSFAGAFGSSLISTTAGPDGTFSFGARPSTTDQGEEFIQAGSATIQDLTTSAGAEVPAIGMVNFLRRAQLFTYNLEADTTRQLVVNCAFKGGTALEDLSKGASPEYYAQIPDLMSKTHTAASTASYGVAAFCLLQGEANYSLEAADNTEAGYKASLLQIAEDMAADALTETSQTYPPGLFLCQTSSAWDAHAGDISSIGNAQLAAALETPNIYLVGPYYAYPDDGTNHLTSDGYRWLGQKFGQVVHKVLIQGQGWMPCHIKNAWFRGDKVLLEYHVPEPPLQVQPAYIESTPTTFDNRGFRLGDDEGAISITSIEVKKSSIVLTMARETTTADNPWVQYAGEATYDGAGNICDSDPTISYNVDSVSGDPYPLWNWAVGQRLTIVEDA